MISFRIGECDFDLIPAVKGLISEKEKVLEALDSKEYDAAAVALGAEDVQAITKRDEIEGEFEPSDLDVVYSGILAEFGPIDMPDPASTVLIDECGKRNIPVIPLDMTDEEYTQLYCETVSTVEFLREKYIIKKALKNKFDKSSPEKFATEWDDLVNHLKGYAMMSKYREEHMANQIKDISKYRRKVLVVVEYERVKGTMDSVGEHVDL